MGKFIVDKFPRIFGPEFGSRQLQHKRLAAASPALCISAGWCGLLHVSINVAMCMQAHKNEFMHTLVACCWITTGAGAGFMRSMYSMMMMMSKRMMAVTPPARIHLVMRLSNSCSSRSRLIITERDAVVAICRVMRHCEGQSSGGYTRRQSHNVRAHWLRHSILNRDNERVLTLTFRVCCVEDSEGSKDLKGSTLWTPLVRAISLTSHFGRNVMFSVSVYYEVVPFKIAQQIFNIKYMTVRVWFLAP